MCMHIFRLFVYVLVCVSMCVSMVNGEYWCISKYRMKLGRITSPLPVLLNEFELTNE